MSVMEIDTVWRSAFGDNPARPVLYSSNEVNEDGWQPLTDPHKFIMKLETLSPQQLYAVSSNNAEALKQAQFEYLELERDIAAMKGTEKLKDPQALPDAVISEEQKEAALYGFTHKAKQPALLVSTHPTHSTDTNRKDIERAIPDQEKKDVRTGQNPFHYGGFYPPKASDASKEPPKTNAKTKGSKAPPLPKPINKNPDGWKPVVDKDGRKLIPRQQIHHDEYPKAPARGSVNANVNGEVARPTSADSSEVPSANDTHGKAVDKRLTRTRFNGTKVPSTRDDSEEPSGASTPRGRKRTSPADEESTDAPQTAKRQKVILNVKDPNQPKPKHPNQYTKAKERAAKEAAELAAANNGTPQPPPTRVPTPAAPPKSTDWRDFTSEQKYNHTWTNADLHDAIREDHSWLHDDPVKAEQWMKKLLVNQNPIRSFAMFKKWRYWKVNDLDKRPRNKNAGAANGPSPPDTGAAGQTVKPKRRAAKSKTAPTSAAATPGVTPAPDAADGAAPPDTGDADQPAKAKRRTAKSKTAPTSAATTPAPGAADAPSPEIEDDGNVVKHKRRTAKSKSAQASATTTPGGTPVPDAVQVNGRLDTGIALAAGQKGAKATGKRKLDADASSQGTSRKRKRGETEEDHGGTDVNGETDEKELDEGNGDRPDNGTSEANGQGDDGATDTGIEEARGTEIGEDNGKANGEETSNGKGHGPKKNVEEIPETGDEEAEEVEKQPASPSQETSQEVNGHARKRKRPNLKTERSGSTISVNTGAINTGATAATKSNGVPPRRSQRKRRASG